MSWESIADHVGKVALNPLSDSGRTLVEWTPSYQSDDENAVTEFCNPACAGLLDSLNSKFWS